MARSSYSWRNIHNRQAPEFKFNAEFASNFDLKLIFKNLVNNCGIFFSIQIPRATELEKRISYCFCFPLCRSNNIELTAHIPQQGYTPGQTIDLELDVNNKTVEDVNEIKVKLVKVSRFPSGSGIFERQRPKTVNLQIVDRWSSSEEMRKYRIQLVVPPLPPSDEENSRVVKISYKLQVKITRSIFLLQIRIVIVYTFFFRLKC